MVKLIESSQFDDAAEIGARLAEPKSAAMAKEAENVFGQSYDALKPSDPGKYVGIHLTALGDEEAYGCFFAGAPVLTPDGQRPIESLSEGDSVITHTGAVAQIARVFESAYNGARVDVSVTGLPDPIACTADHPFLVVSRRGLSPASRFRLRARGTLAAEIDRRAESAEWVRADELEEGDYLVIPTQLASDVDIPPAFDPYACGYYLADGCLVREYRDIATRGDFKGVLLSSSVAKEPALDRIDAWLASIGRHVPARQTSYTSDAGVRCEILYKEWACWLDDAFGHDGVCKHLSPVIWSWGADDRLAFLAGYFDGDGCVAHRTGARWDGTLVASTASRSLALDLQRLLASVGIPSSVSHGMNRVCTGCFGSSDGDIYALSVGACSAQRILRLTSRLRPVEREFMQHASASMQIGTRYALVRISGVELSETAATKYNLEVPGDNSYVVDVAVHNCNRNFDSFPRSACRLYHDTFVKHGHVFSHHNNDASRDPILGCIKASAYNEKMHRIELFIWADREKAKEGLDTLEKTGECSFSMACSVPFDECSICRTRRRNSRDPNMCDHIRHDLGKMAEDGRIAFMRNVEPDFFDISFVTRPADRIAYSLKVASADPSVPITGERLAKLAGLVEPDYIRPGRAADKHDALRKLADAYERASRGALPGLFAPVAACAASRIDDATVDTLRRMPVKQAMAFLADRGVVLDPAGFCKYAMGPGSAEFVEFAPYTDSIGALAAQIVKDAAFTGRFDVTSTTAFDCDAFTSRASRRFADVAAADAVLKRASFADANIQDLAAESVCASGEKRAERGKCSFDGRDDIWFTTHARPVLSTAMKYAEYKVSALASLLHGDACRSYNTNSDALLALVAVQDVH